MACNCYRQKAVHFKMLYIVIKSNLKVNTKSYHRSLLTLLLVSAQVLIDLTELQRDRATSKIFHRLHKWMSPLKIFLTLNRCTYTVLNTIDFSTCN